MALVKRDKRYLVNSQYVFISTIIPGDDLVKKLLASGALDNNLIVWNLQQVGTLDKLLVQGCQWIKDYLKNNPNLEKGDRQLCETDFTIKG
ncbi:MAG: hypothetical protein U7127_14875 [Phormidium sp.]